MDQGISDLWKYDSSVIEEAIHVDFENFKSNSANYKIALFNPETNGYKYLRTLVYQLCRSLTQKQIEKLKRIENKEYGNPISVTYHGQKICLDYLQAVYEIDFIERHNNFENQYILEIGAGYGRTCHTILSNYDVQRYYILDLETCLNLSQKYLKTVLNEKNYSKIQFVPVADFPLLENVKFDISINIDSMSEMTSKIVYDYLLYIDKHSRLFFVKNPVGKYMLNDSSDDTPDQDAVSHALSTGILKDIIEVEKIITHFLEKL